MMVGREGRRAGQHRCGLLRQVRHARHALYLKCTSARPACCSFPPDHHHLICCLVSFQLHLLPSCLCLPALLTRPAPALTAPCHRTPPPCRCSAPPAPLLCESIMLTTRAKLAPLTQSGPLNPLWSIAGSMPCAKGMPNAATLHTDGVMRRFQPRHSRVNNKRLTGFQAEAPTNCIYYVEIHDLPAKWQTVPVSLKRGRRCGETLLTMKPTALRGGQRVGHLRAWRARQRAARGPV